MLVSELKPLDEVLRYLAQDSSVFLLGCNGCAEACETGGEPQVKEIAKALEGAGKTVAGSAVLDFLCEKALLKAKLRAYEDEIVAADSVLVLSCGVGIQAAAASIDRVVHPGCNTISLGGSPGKWRGPERCAECGDCLLDFTGGICPVTACTKSLINGACGGTREGRCEHEPEVRPCGWYLIYERLKKLDRLDRMRSLVPPKDFSKAQPPKQLRSTSVWALEQIEKGKEAARR